MGTVDDSATTRPADELPTHRVGTDGITPIPPPTTPHTTAAIELVDTTGRLDDQETQWLAAQGLAVLKHLSLVGKLSVKIIDDQAMSEAHLEFLDDPSTTDVLTFDMSDEDGLDVDIMCCIDEAERRASDHRHDRARELLLYVVHGVLHASGFDDIEEADRIRMHEREDEILSAIGVGATYNRSARSGDSESGSAAS